MRRRRRKVGVGFQLYSSEGGEAFGAVREVSTGDRPVLIVNIENAGDHRVPLEAVVAVHDGKVIVDVSRLSVDVASAIRRAHDAESSGF